MGIAALHPSYATPILRTTVGWVEKRYPSSAALFDRWVSLRSTHPTLLN